MGFPRLSVCDDIGKEKPPADETTADVKAVVGNFAKRTSMHGCGYIRASHHWSSKVVWALITMLAIVCLILHLYTIIYDFLQRPKATKVTLSFNNLQFPAITICNANPLRKSKLSVVESEFLQDLIKSLDLDSYEFVDSGNVSRERKRELKNGSKVTFPFSDSHHKTYSFYFTLIVINALSFEETRIQTVAQPSSSRLVFSPVCPLDR